MAIHYHFQHVEQEIYNIYNHNEQQTQTYDKNQNPNIFEINSKFKKKKKKTTTHKTPNILDGQHELYYLFETSRKLLWTAGKGGIITYRIFNFASSARFS